MEIPTPVPDGVTTVFQVSQTYQANSLSVWLNGVRLVARLDDGYEESIEGAFQMKEAPLPGDTLQVKYGVP